MNKLLTCVLCVIILILLVAIFYGHNSNTTKTVSQLTEEERGGLESLTEKIYKDAGAKFLYTTTYYMMPTENGSLGEKLDKPITLLSGASIGSHMLMEDTLETIKRGMRNKIVEWKGSGGKCYRLSILEGYLVPSPGGAGGSMYSSNDMVTIVPTKIQIIEE